MPESSLHGPVRSSPCQWADSEEQWASFHSFLQQLFTESLLYAAPGIGTGFPCRCAPNWSSRPSGQKEINQISILTFFKVQAKIEEKRLEENIH